VRLAIAFLLLLMPTLANAARDARKCGRLLVARAEQAVVAKERYINLPRGCDEALFPAGYEGHPGVQGTELWHGVKRVAWAVLPPGQHLKAPVGSKLNLTVKDVRKSTLKHKPVTIATRPKVHKRTIRVYWEGNTKVIEETEEVR